MLTLSGNSTIINVTYEIKLCHKPDQKPALFPAASTTSAVRLVPATQLASRSTAKIATDTKKRFFVTVSRLKLM
jgi:hypothetical protein